jgi:hypothetical protein
VDDKADYQDVYDILPLEGNYVIERHKRDCSGSMRGTKAILKRMYLLLVLLSKKIRYYRRLKGETIAGIRKAKIFAPGAIVEPAVSGP